MTAFLGYYNSPIWSKLNLISSYISVYNNVIINLLLLLFIISFILFYLDNFKLSKTHFIKYFQIFSFINLLFMFILFLSNNINLADMIYYANDKDINLHGYVTLDKEAAKHIGQGLNTIGSNIGLGAAMVGISTAVGKTITKSSMPPLQKAGFIVGSGLAEGLGHSMISTLNRNQILSENINTSASAACNTTSTANNLNSNISKFLDNSQSSPLQDLLFQFEAMNYVCLTLIYILIIQLVFKLYINDNVNLNLSKLLGNNINNKMEYYLNKIIKLNKQMSTVWIWFGFIILMFGLTISAYTVHNIYANMNSFINVHNWLKSNSINNICTVDKSIEDILLSLLMLDYMCIVIMISLIIQIVSKLHFKNNEKLNLSSILGANINNKLEYYLNKIIYLNKKMSVIYIWLMILSLILALSFSAYTCNELYTNIDSYINVHNSIKNNGIIIISIMNTRRHKSNVIKSF